MTTPEPATTLKQPSQSAPAASSSYPYATFPERLVAAIVDSIIVGFVGAVIGGIFAGLTGYENYASIISFLISSIYYVYLIGSSGQTIGKKLMKIKVVKKMDTTTPPDYVGAFVREVIGKLISAIVLLLGYFWMLWDDQKQTWHDKIADTVVIKVQQ